MLKLQYRVRKNREYNHIYKYGTKKNGKYMLIFVCKNELDYNRYGIVTSKKIGKAVKRNRIKRRIRAIIYKNLIEFKRGYDVVVIPRANIYNEDFALIEKDLLNICRRIGILGIC